MLESLSRVVSRQSRMGLISDDDDYDDNDDDDDMCIFCAEICGDG